MMDSKQEGISFSALQCSKEIFRLFIIIQRGLKIFWNSNVFVRSIRRIPATILFGKFDRLQSRWFHLATGDQFFYFFGIDLRPDAFRSTGRELLKPVLIVKSLFL